MNTPTVCFHGQHAQPGWTQRIGTQNKSSKQQVVGMISTSRVSQCNLNTFANGSATCHSLNPFVHRGNKGFSSSMGDTQSGILSLGTKVHLEGTGFEL